MSNDARAKGGMTYKLTRGASGVLNSSCQDLVRQRPLLQRAVFELHCFGANLKSTAFVWCHHLVISISYIKPRSQSAIFQSTSCLTPTTIDGWPLCPIRVVNPSMNLQPQHLELDTILQTEALQIARRVQSNPLRTAIPESALRESCILDAPDSCSTDVTAVRQLKCTSGSARAATGPVLALFQGSL
jgi:hypothetical protein